jgi:hypothetical protein
MQERESSATSYQQGGTTAWFGWFTKKGRKTTTKCMCSCSSIDGSIRAAATRYGGHTRRQMLAAAFCFSYKHVRHLGVAPVEGTGQSPGSKALPTQTPLLRHYQKPEPQIHPKVLTASFDARAFYFKDKNLCVPRVIGQFSVHSSVYR